MMHPSTRPGFFKDEIGLGVFAVTKIPKGSIVYCKDPLEIVISKSSPLLDNDHVSEIIRKYSYIEPNGARILSWDHAKYVNHSCSPNSMSTGYGFEIALCDILPGEQITDEYGLFNIEKDMKCYCGSSQCRGSILGNDVKTFGSKWDEKIKDALAEFKNVPQPLLPFVSGRILKHLFVYLETGRDYKSVTQLFLDLTNSKVSDLNTQRRKSQSKVSRNLHTKNG